MLRIEHVALWTEDIDRLAGFYAKYFQGKIGSSYLNAAKGFESRFLSFEGGARLELMKTSRLNPLKSAPGAQRMGLTHLAIGVGSQQQVVDLTNRLRLDGFAVLDGPRQTGDGYFESVILDPDGNRIEVTI
jgi:lactoylglutathione lyase